MEYERAGERTVAEVTLERRPDSAGRTGRSRNGAPGSEDGVPDGVMVGNVTSEIRRQLEIPENLEGAVVTAVEPGSAAAQQGLRPGDVIIEMEGTPIRNADEAVRRSEELPGPKTMLRVWREGRNNFLLIDESPTAEREGPKRKSP